MPQNFKNQILGSTAKTDAAIYNAAGLLIKKLTLAATPGVTTMPVDDGRFAKGLYLIQLQAAAGIEKVSFSKQ